MQKLQSTGTLIFDPKTQQTKHYEDWWLILRCDESIAQYYRYWVKRSLGIPLQRSLWGSHISIIRGELPCKNKDLWKTDHKTQVVFAYSPELLRNNNTHWWLDVNLEPLAKYRRLFGLSEKPAFSFHLTIGRIMSL